MAEYSYEALDRGGKQVRGVIEAGSEQVIVEKLRNMGYYPVSVGLSRKRAMGNTDITALPGLRLFFHRVRNKDVMTFTRQLATLIDAGLPIIRSLTILQEQVESVLLRDKIGQIAKDIEQGSSLSDALAKHPKIFDRLYVNMVRAGEIGGVLEAVLVKIADFLEKRQAIIGKVRSAMMYPAVVLTLATAIVTFILIVIVPKFKDIFQQLGGDLPWLTRVLIDISYALVNYTAWVIVGIVAIVFAFKRINQTRGGKLFLDTLKLRIPIVGKLFRKSAIVRFASTLATLITSGVPILQAIDIVRETSGNEVVTRAMDSVYTSVRDGETIHEPLGRCKVFPPLVVHMVAVGEETGAIDAMLQKVSEAYEREVEDTVNALTSILEPILIVFLGAIVGVIVVGLYLPIFAIPGILAKGAN